VHQEEGLNDRAKSLADQLESQVHGLRDKPHIRDIRNIGVLAAVELAPRPGEVGARGVECRRHALEEGVLIRAAGDILLLSPPLTFTDDDMSLLVASLGRALDRVA
ncbi:aminotransferase class III-fold pyridoxal phosphate-dependent enzyme, partial [Rhizobiaceae sp. 2RAB30]